MSFLMLTPLLSNEIQRIEAIVEDISNLRVSYEECKKELSSKVRVSKSSDADLKEINRLKRLLKAEIEKNDILLTKTVCKPKVIIEKCEDLNVFPNLMMEKNYSKKTLEKEIIKEFKASSFRLKNKSDIYNSIDGKVIQSWEEGRSFTSNIGSQNWIKITGYFIDRQWIGAKIDLWIKKDKVLRR